MVLEETLRKEIEFVEGLRFLYDRELYQSKTSKKVVMFFYIMTLSIGVIFALFFTKDISSYTSAQTWEALFNLLLNFVFGVLFLTLNAFFVCYWIFGSIYEKYMQISNDRYYKKQKNKLLENHKIEESLYDEEAKKYDGLKYSLDYYLFDEKAQKIIVENCEKQLQRRREKGLLKNIVGFSFLVCVVLMCVALFVNAAVAYLTHILMIILIIQVIPLIYVLMKMKK